MRSVAQRSINEGIEKEKIEVCKNLLLHGV